MHGQAGVVQCSDSPRIACVECVVGSVRPEEEACVSLSGWEGLQRPVGPVPEGAPKELLKVGQALRGDFAPEEMGPAGSVAQRFDVQHAWRGEKCAQSHQDAGVAARIERAFSPSDLHIAYRREPVHQGVYRPFELGGRKHKAGVPALLDESHGCGATGFSGGGADEVGASGLRAARCRDQHSCHDESGRARVSWQVHDLVILKNGCRGNERMGSGSCYAPARLVLSGDWPRRHNIHNRQSRGGRLRDRIVPHRWEPGCGARAKGPIRRAIACRPGAVAKIHARAPGFLVIVPTRGETARRAT